MVTTMHSGSTDDAECSCQRAFHVAGVMRASSRVTSIVKLKLHEAQLRIKKGAESLHRTHQ